MWGGRDQGILAGEVELADGNFISRSHRFCVMHSRRFSGGDDLLRFLGGG
jgi:hypothetical protein